MPKTANWLSLLAVLSSASYGLAVDNYVDESEYKVYCLEPPPLPGGPYITFSVGHFTEEIEDIIALTTSGGTPPSVSQPNSSDSGTQYTVALGYQITDYGIFNRAEIAYTYRGSIDYNADPALNLVGVENSIYSTIKNFTLLGKFYWDIYKFNFLTPYIQAGVGFSHNELNSTGYAQLPPLTPVSLTTEQNKTDFAWDAGAGVRAQVGRNFYLDLNYEYDYLGKDLQWQVPFFIATGPSTPLESGDLHSNSYNLGLTYIFR